MSVIGPVGDHVAAGEAGEQGWCCGDVMRLACRENDANRQTIFVHQRIDLCTQSSTRTTDGVIWAPFFPPAACWWARMIDESIRAME